MIEYYIMKLLRGDNETTCLTGFCRCPSASTFYGMRLSGVWTNKLKYQLPLQNNWQCEVGIKI